ncbi:MAG: UDP-N-acetylmuramate--L-alanine ligase [Alphaproteobacteria bacterium]|nr:UDP-N-acetylmuramate--L-alanine ligase [Alphaproteobacteria bacterium]
MLMFDLAQCIGCVHFVGLGGIGMSGLAEFMKEIGFDVQGSNDVENANTKRLQDLGISVFIGHKKENVENAKVLVFSTAIKEGNPELLEAKNKKLPILHRGEMLAEIMKKYNCISIAGTHGKTTTTGMIYSVLEAAKEDPNLIIGGILNNIHSNMKVGKGSWIIVEADESDGTFLKLPTTNAVITNIDPEHLDHYGDFQNMLKSFRKFAHQLPFYGSVSLCYEHPQTRALAKTLPFNRHLTYGFDDKADVQALHLRLENNQQKFDIRLNREEGKIISDMTLQVFGLHSVLNALAAFCQGLFLQIDPDKIKEGLSNFKGVERRFTQLGLLGGAMIYDDYAHHPVEIKSVIRAAKSIAKGKVYVVFQPHRYTRVYTLIRDFATCFNEADCVMITDIYSAGEKPILGVDKNFLCREIQKSGFKSVEPLDKIENLKEILLQKVKTDDIVLCLGAGSISNYAHQLVQQN